MGSSCAPLKRGIDPFTPSGSRFDCILLERHVNTFTSGDFPFVQLGRDLHPSFLQLGFLHLEVLFFTLTRDHVFPETYPRQSNLFQFVKEKQPSFAVVMVVVVVVVVVVVAVVVPTRVLRACLCRYDRTGMHLIWVGERLGASSRRPRHLRPNGGGFLACACAPGPTSVKTSTCCNCKISQSSHRLHPWNC